MATKKLLLSIMTGLALYSTNANAELFFSQDGNGNGLFELNTSTGAATLVGAGISGVTSSTVGLAPSSDPTILFGSTPGNIVEIQADGSGTNTLGSNTEEALAYCASNNTLYAALNGVFSSINPADGTQIAALAPPGFDVEGLACNDATNTVYGIGAFGATNLVAYDIGTNTWSTIGDTGIDWGNPGLAFDPGANILYAIRDSDDSLYSINPTTAVATLIGPLGIDATGGLAFTGASSSTEAIPTLSFWGILATIFGLGLLGRRRKK